ncbi:sensor histidine kinase [Phormidesmis priestleyi]
MFFLKRSPENKGLIGGFLVLTLLMGLGSAASYQNATQLIENSKKSQQTYQIIKRLVDVFATMTVVESGRRGYIYSGDQKELERYKTAIVEFEPELTEIRILVSTDPKQSKQLVKLESLLSQRLALLSASIDLYQKDQSALLTQSLITDRSVVLRDQIQTVINEMRTQEEQELEKSIKQSQVSIYERKLIETWLTLSSFSILILGFLAFYSQLVRRQQAEASEQKLSQQKEMSELKLRFFSMVSHEFRTPLSVILGSVELLIESQQYWAEDRKQKNLRRIQSSAKAMTQLLTDILTLTRAEAGKLQCNPEPLDLEAFCLNLIEDFECVTPTIYSFQFTSDCYYAHARLDEKLLYSTLGNLLSNSIKYSPTGGKIKLILNDEPEVIVFRVKDEGLGIPLADRPRLYEPFYRGQNATTIAGTGLGLAVVKKCVDLQNGEMTLESQEGIGTTFTVKIPRGGRR